MAQRSWKVERCTLRPAVAWIPRIDDVAQWRGGSLQLKVLKSQATYTFNTSPSRATI